MAAEQTASQPIPECCRLCDKQRMEAINCQEFPPPGVTDLSVLNCWNVGQGNGRKRIRVSGGKFNYKYRSKRNNQIGISVVKRGNK